MPKGGFGNLIALPLQGESRKGGNSVFVDEHFQPYDDQWAFLSSVRKIKDDQIQSILSSLIKDGNITGVQWGSAEDEQDDMPWEQPSVKGKELITGPLPEKIKMIQSNLLCIEKNGLSSATLNRLNRLVAFQNPEFYKAQALRLSTFDKPRIIGCAEDYPKHPARQKYRCNTCKSYFDDLTGTLFSGHHQPLSVWILCLYFMGLHLSNRQIASELGIGQGSVQVITSYLRTYVAEKKPTVTLEGEVECDEVYCDDVA
jgi:transposase-like protein